MIKPASCVICGRALSSPESVAAGAGPICGDRGYVGRVQSRHGNGDMPGLEALSNPCFGCDKFSFPTKTEEVKIPDGYLVAMRDRAREFDQDAIGGYCKPLKMLVDGNRSKSGASCRGKWYRKRVIGNLEDDDGN